MTGGVTMPYGSIVEMTARVLAVFALLCFAVFAQALWAPKSSVGQTSREHQLHQPASAPKKKGKNAKKKQKARGASAKTNPSNVGTLSDEELEAVKEQSASDVEAPPITSRRVTDTNCDSGPVSEHALTSAQIYPSVSADADDKDLEMCTLTSIKIGSSNSEHSSACEDTRELVLEAEEAHLPEETHSISKPCTTSSELGCPIQRTYTKSLLLMHCTVQQRIARGPPGLEAPSADVSVDLHRIRSVHLSS
jgi:hypothetical protein